MHIIIQYSVFDTITFIQCHVLNIIIEIVPFFHFQMAFTFVAMQTLPKFIKTHTSQHPDNIVSSILIGKKR